MKTKQKFYINYKEIINGDYLIHSEKTYHFQPENLMIYFGVYSDCKQAIADAEEIFNTSVSCFKCSCHKTIIN